ncbi:MAG: hypothetical protein R2697_19840 [Ilumatobacteraceae bacterium]
MPSVGTPVIRRIVAVARSGEPESALLRSVGLSADPGAAPWQGEAVDADAYYDLIERLAWPDDPELPFRYGASIRADDLGASGWR